MKNPEPAPNNTEAVLRRRAPAPPGLAPLRFMFGTLGYVVPGLMARVANRVWFRTRRFPLTAREREVLGRARRGTVQVGALPVAVYEWGEGPAVAMVHGWHGSAANFAAFVDPLVAAGLRVIAIDQPAHGATPGDRTTAFEIADALNAVARQYGPFAAWVGHSFGTLCALVARSGGFAAPRAVCISPPAEMSSLLQSFAETLNLPPPVMARFTRSVEREFGADIWDRLSPARVVYDSTTIALIIHDRNDRAMPIEEGEALARAWPNAQFHGTRGLGHTRILSDPKVLTRVVEFLADTEKRPAKS
jgi:pimeloyl-ACP methyl ester carboxylesterase